MTVISGSAPTRTEHSLTRGGLGLLISMMVPMALVVAGIAVHGWGGD
jgi:hypothetical protein